MYRPSRPEDWEAYRDVISHLYSTKKLKDVMKEMERQYYFKATYAIISSIIILFISFALIFQVDFGRFFLFAFFMAVFNFPRFGGFIFFFLIAR